VQWGVRAQQEAIASFAKELDTASLEVLSAHAWRQVAARLLELFYYHPSVAEATAYGRFPVAEDQNEAVFQPLAQRFGPRDAINALRRGTAEHHHNEWRPGAKALTPPGAYLAVRLAEKSFSMLRKVQA
jgi:hypothetical protein